jgi:energy-coupling factor transporter ATP-binding protein EcfA2
MSKLVIKPGSISLFVARRGSGKTYLLKYLLGVLARSRAVCWIEVISPTSFNGEWSTVVGEKHVQAVYSEQWVEQLLAGQARLLENGTPNPGLLILDDCLGSVNLSRPVFTRLAAAGRHYGLTLFITSQHLWGLPPVLRQNADQVFVLGHPNTRTVSGLMEELAPRNIDTARQLAAVIKRATANYGALCISLAEGGRMVTVRAPALAQARQFRISQ